MTSDSGTYVLLLRADAEREIEVGALGAMPVQPGVYTYVGSAFGPGGVQARVRRHARADGSPHWHVDSLRAVTVLEAAWYTHDDTGRECFWAQVLCSFSEGCCPCLGFGASDCDCPAHLFRFEGRPSLGAFREEVQGRCPDHAPIRRIDADEIQA